MGARDDFPAMAKVLNAGIKWTDESIAAEMDRALDEIDRLRDKVLDLQEDAADSWDRGYHDGIETAELRAEEAEG